MSYWTDEEIEVLKKSNESSFAIGKHLDRSSQSVRRKASNLGIHLGKHGGSEPIFSINKDFFKVWTTEMAYILGFWFADGCIKKNTQKSAMCIEFVSKDKDILQKINSAMKSDYRLHMDKNNSYRIWISNTAMAHDILALGGTERKSLTNTFPEVPSEFVYDFIRGYWDGDGYISILDKNDYPEIGCVGTYQFLDSIKNYLNWTKVTKNSQKTNLYSLHYYGEKAQQVMSLLYNNASIAMDRKYDLYLRGMQWCRQKGRSNI